MTADEPYAPRGNGNTIRQELWRIEDRLADDISDARRVLTDFINQHREEHAEIVRVHTARLGSIMDKFQADAIADARQDGALAVVRRTLEILSRNWPALIALATGALALSGNLRISVQ